MFKNVSKKLWILTIVLIAISIVFTIIFEVLRLLDVIKFEPTYITTLIGMIYLLIGWMVPNNTEFKYRKETSNYNGELPSSLKEKKFKVRFPFISSALIVLIISVIWFYL